MLSKLISHPAKVPFNFIKLTLFTPYSLNFFSNIIGIDLGTTNSCVAIMDGQTPKVIENSEGDKTTPSVLAYTNDGRELIGITAKRQQLLNALNTFYATKRLIGRKYIENQIKEDIKNLPYKISKGPNNEIIFKAQGKDINPIFVASKILYKIKNSAENFLNKKINKAIITVPAYFNDHQRQATKKAGELAGLNVIRIINEPTAAALAYGIGLNNNKLLNNTSKKIAVYDLGGGTFDISILELSNGIFEVKATNGNTNLGGEDFDNLLVKHLAEKFKKQSGINLNLKEHSQALQRLKESAEKAKVELSSTTKAEIDLPFLAMDKKGNPLHFKYDLTRKEYEELVSGLVDKTLLPCKNCLSDSGLSKSEIDEVIMVGGMTRTPFIRKRIGEFFNKTPKTNVNPDEAVAIGAAIQGGILEGEVKDMLLLDVTPLSLGIETMGGIFSKIIDRNTTVPTKKTQLFSTAVDDQDTVIVKVFQGENELTKNNNLLGQFELTGIPKAKRGVPKIEVSFDIDANGIVNVSAKDTKTGKSMGIELKTEKKTIKKERQSKAKI